MSRERTLNLLGTAALLLADEQLESIERVTGLGVSGAAALTTIGHAPDQSIDFVRRALRRTHSSAVRLIRTLTERGWLSRGTSADARAVELRLAPAGRTQLQRVLSARRDALEPHLERLSSQEQADLARLLSKLLGGAVTDEMHAFQICRLCDGDACDDCPVESVFDSTA